MDVVYFWLVNDSTTLNQPDTPPSPSGSIAPESGQQFPGSIPSAPLDKPKSSKKKLTIIALVIAIILAGAFVTWYIMHNNPTKRVDQNTTTQTSQANTQKKIKQLCYIKVSVECYADGNFSNVVKPEVFSNLNVIRVIPSPNDDKLAILAGTTQTTEVYITDSKLQPTKINLGKYKKSDSSLSWLEDQSALVFEADVNNAQTTRVILKYDIQKQQITELTKTSNLSTDPLVSGNTIVFKRYDLKANPTSAWRWYKMTIDSKAEEDLGINSGYGGTIRDGKLIVASDKFTEVDIQTKQQKQLTGDQLSIPTSTGSGLIALGDGRLVFTFKQDENQNGPNDRIAIVDAANNKTTILNNDGASEPFETVLFQ